MSSLLSSLRFLASATPISLHPTKLFLRRSSKPTNLSFYRSIAFQQISTGNPTPPQSSSSPPPSAAQLQPIEDLPPKLQELIRLFQSVPDARSKYEQLLFYGRNLKPLEQQFKTKENKVEGCVSQVWVRAFLDKDNNVVFEADSDSLLTKGLAALLVNGLSGRPVEEVLRVSPDFALLLGLQQSLTPSRSNGFLNMLKLMQRKAFQLIVESKTSGGKSDTSSAESNPQMAGSQSPVTSSSSNLDGNSDKGSRENSSFGSNSGGLGARGMRIREKLDRELRPVELEVADVSYQHAGHDGVRGSDGETHFNVKIVSQEFEGKTLIKRHRLIYDLLQDELQSGLHALSIVAKTPSEVGPK